MRYIALLRGINVGGSGLLPMKDLAALCEGLGCTSVRTYIQSGNVVFDSPLQETKIQATLEAALEACMGKKIPVMIRNGEELRGVLHANPFPDCEPAKIGVHFLHAPPPADLLARTVAPGGEQVHPGRREVYVYYPDGMGRTRLKLPLEAPATVRNINTVARLVGLAEGAS